MIERPTEDSEEEYEHVRNKRLERKTCVSIAIWTMRMKKSDAAFIYVGEQTQEWIVCCEVSGEMVSNSSRGSMTSLWQGMPLLNS